MIVRSTDLERLSPSLLLFEHRHLSPLDFLRAVRHARAKGYRCCKDTENTWCLGGWRWKHARAGPPRTVCGCPDVWWPSPDVTSV